MGVLKQHLGALYRRTRFGSVELRFGTLKSYGYFDQEETLGTDINGDNLLLKRTVFRMPTPAVGSRLNALAQDSLVSVYDPNTEQTTQYRVSYRELVGDGLETRLVLRPA